MKKTICFILTAIVAGYQFSFAQSSKNDTIARRSVVIERDYIPTANNVEKLEVAPVITEPQLTKNEVNYSEQLFPQTPDYEVNKWPAAAIHLHQNTYKKGYALVGFGLYGTALGDLLYPIVDDATQRLTFDTHIHGLFGDKQRQLITNFGLNYQKRLETMDLNMGAYFKRNGFNHYGVNGAQFNTLTNYKDSTNSFTNFGLKAGIRSKTDDEAVAYKAEFGFNNFTPETGLGEQQIRLKGNIDLPLGEHRIGVDIDNYNFFYSKYNNIQVYPSHSIVGVNPYFGMKGDNWNVRIGLKDYFSINGKGKSMYIMPDVTAQINMTKTVNLYAGITGEYNANSMQRITDENAYFNAASRVEDSYAPVKLSGGVKFAPQAGLLINGSVSYTSYNKQYFYINQFNPDMYWVMLTNYIFPISINILTPSFDVEYSKANVTTANLNISYNWKDRLFVHANGKYNNWDTQSISKAWMKPSSEIEIGGEAKITRNVFVSANYYYAGGRYANLLTAGSTKMSDISDLSLGASYSYSDWLTAFIRLNNILGNNNQTWYGYDALKLNWQIGAAVSF